MDPNPNEGETGDLGEELITVKGEAEMLAGCCGDTDTNWRTLNWAQIKAGSIIYLLTVSKYNSIQVQMNEAH